jgi:hypothetical protein
MNRFSLFAKNLQFNPNQYSEIYKPAISKKRFNSQGIKPECGEYRARTDDLGAASATL